jgi:CRP-like cAMP-binding protein
MTRGSMTSVGASSGNSLTKLQARSVVRMSSLMDAQKGHAQSFRLARIGPGWVAGTLEAISGMRRVGDVVAVTHCRLHHLPYTKIQKIEKENPALILNLYKLLSYLMARRQEGTIGQLATLHSIMASPAQLRPLGRKASKQM